MYEMANHEYAINWQGNWDVLSCFGNIKYDHEHDDQDLDFYFDQLEFTKTQRSAFMPPVPPISSSTARIIDPGFPSAPAKNKKAGA